MLGVPAFGPRYRVWTMPEGALLLAEDDSVLLRGAAYVEILSRVDGRNTMEGILASIDAGVRPATLAEAAARLEAGGYLVEAPPAGAPPDPATEFWQAQGVAPELARQRLAAATVEVRAVGNTDPEALRRVLGGVGLLPAEAGPPSVTVVLTDDYIRREIRDHNQAALVSGRPWLLARPVGQTFWVGPLLRPGTTACWECLRQRLALHRPAELWVQRRFGFTGPAAPARLALPSAQTAFLHTVAAALLRLVVTGTHPDLEGSVATIDTLTLETSRHRVTRLPQCPACGLPARWGGPPEPFAIRPVPAGTHDEGGTRSTTPEDFVARLDRHISPVSGVVQRLSPVTAPGDPVRVYTATYNHAFRGDDLLAFRRHVRSAAAGKGSTNAQAQASAVGEAVERYSGVFQGYEARRLCRAADLGGDAVAPQLLSGWSDRQYAGRPGWPASRALGRMMVCAPLSPERTLAWTPVWSLTRQRLRHVPTAFCYYDYRPAPEEAGEPVCLADSNGCAAGATPEEALLQGLLELVERDAVAIWWYNRLCRPPLSLAASPDRHVRRVVEYQRGRGREIWALDLTSDVGVPVAAVIGAPVSGPSPGVAVGFAAHLDPGIALRRAVNECAQTVSALALVRRPSGVPDEPTLRWLRDLRVDGEPYLHPHEGAPRAPGQGACGPASGDAGADARRLVSRLEALGLEVLVLDQTRPDLGVPVVKAIVPGLRHFWPRLGPGRLYDVPVELGWLARARTEDEMNPMPMLL